MAFLDNKALLFDIYRGFVDANNLLTSSFPAPPRDVSLIYGYPDENHINLTCSAQGIYPKPDIKLSWGKRWF